MLAFAITGGAWIFLAVLIILGLAVAYGLYTLRGSAISRHPYHHVHAGAPGADRPDEFSDFETFEGQYLGRRRRRHTR